MAVHPFERKEYHDRVNAIMRLQGVNPHFLTKEEHSLFGSSTQKQPESGAGEGRKEKFRNHFAAYWFDQFELPEEMQKMLDSKGQDFVLVNLPSLETALNHRREAYYLVDHEGKAVLDAGGRKILIKPEVWKGLLEKTKNRKLRE